MARSKFNIRQLDILSSSAAISDGVQNAVSDDDLFIFQNNSAGSEMKAVDAQTLQSYFSEIDLTGVGSGEYTLVFADIDNDQDGVTEGYALKYDNQDTDALSWNASTNLLKVSGSLNLADDSVAVRFGADQDVTLSHVADTGLQLNSGMELQFRSSDSKIHSSTSSQLDLTGTSVIKSTAPQVEIEASTEVLLDSPKVHLEDDSASLVFGAGEDATIDHDGSDGLQITTAGAYDVDAGTNLNLDASSAVRIGQSTRSSFDLDATDISLSGSTIAIDGSGAATIGAASFDIDADGGAINMDASAAIVIGDTNATTVDIGHTGMETDILGTLSVDEDATFDQNVTITGDLTVNGSTTTLDTVNLLIEDPFVVMAKNASGSPTMDQGLMFERGSADNSAFIWDESATQFALIQTTSSHEVAGNVEIEDYYDLRLGGLTVDDNATVGGTLDVTGKTSLDGDVDLGDASSDTIVFNGLVDSDIKPEDDSTHSLGGSGEEWLKLWVNDIESENGSLDLTADLVTVSGHFDVAGVTASFGALASYSNEDVAVGSDAIMVRDDSDDTAKHMSFVELGQYLSRGTNADAPGTGIQVNDSTGVLSIDVVEQYAVRTDSASSAGLVFTLSDNYSSAILPDSFELFLNGQLQIMDGKKSGYSDYSVSGTSVTMAEAIDTNDVVVIRYLKK